MLNNHLEQALKRIYLKMDYNMYKSSDIMSGKVEVR